MTEQVLSGGTFDGGKTSPMVPSMDRERVVHGGLFGGVPAGETPSPPVGWLGDAHDVLVDSLDVFGEPIEYQPREALPYLVPYGAIFRDSAIEVDPNSGARVSSQEITAGALRDAIPEEWNEHELVIARGKVYQLYDAKDDGEVGVRLHLHEVPA